MATTIGPENRYKDVLFIEKEGFNALLAHALIAEQFDIAIASTKGMSNTALRRLLDGLVSRGMERVFVLHDFDAAGFSIFGTLGTDSRRYTFTNLVNVIDLGLRLNDVRDMGLSYEEYAPAYWRLTSGDAAKARRFAVRDHHPGEPPRRAERDAVRRVRPVPRAEARRTWRQESGSG